MSRVIKAKNNKWYSTLSNVSRSSNIATATTSSDHGLAVNDVVDLDCNDNTYDETNVAVLSVPTSTTFTYDNTGSDESQKAATGNWGIRDTWGGQTIVPNTYYELQLDIKNPEDKVWSKGTSKDKVFADINSGDLVVSKGAEDGSEDIASAAEAWDWLSGAVPTEVEVTQKSATLGHIKTEVHKPEGSDKILVTHDFTDRCTWFGDSTAVVDEGLTDSGDGLTWNSANINWIDLANCRMPNENDHYADYPIVVEVDSVEQTQACFAYATKTYETVVYTAVKKGLKGNDISLVFDGTDDINDVVNAWNAANPFNPVTHDGTGTTVPTATTVDLEAGDYKIDPENGNVIFYADQSGNTVEATYHYESGSTYYMRPATGKLIEMTRAEVQFSKNVKMHTPMNFEVWVYHPDQVTYPGVRVQYAVESYKCIWDLISTGNLGQGTIPALDTLTQETVVFPFDYNVLKIIQDSVGAEVRVTIDDDIPIEGNKATATLYIISKDE